MGWRVDELGGGGGGRRRSVGGGVLLETLAASISTLHMSRRFPVWAYRAELTGLAPRRSNEPR